MKNNVLKQIIKEFWIPLTAAIVWTIWNAVKTGGKINNITDAINIAVPSFFFVSWLTSQYFRVRKQESVSSTLQNIESRVESVLGDISRQTESMAVLSDRQLLQTFDECIDLLREEKEEISDMNRQVRSGLPLVASKFSLKKDNPFYNGYRYLNRLVSYALYTLELDVSEDLKQRYERVAYHSEELAGNITTLMNQAYLQNINWKTNKSKDIIKSVIIIITNVRDKIVPVTKYAAEPYKGGNLVSVLTKHIDKMTAEIS